MPRESPFTKQELGILVKYMDNKQPTPKWRSCSSGAHRTSNHTYCNYDISFLSGTTEMMERDTSDDDDEIQASVNNSLFKQRMLETENVSEAAETSGCNWNGKNKRNESETDSDIDLPCFDGCNVTPRKKVSDGKTSPNTYDPVPSQSPEPSIDVFETPHNVPRQRTSSNSSESSDSLLSPRPKIVRALSLSGWKKRQKMDTSMNKEVSTELEELNSEERNVCSQLYHDFGGSLSSFSEDFLSTSTPKNESSIGNTLPEDNCISPSLRGKPMINPSVDEDTTMAKPYKEDTTMVKPYIEDTTMAKPYIEDTTMAKPYIEDAPMAKASIVSKLSAIEETSVTTSTRISNVQNTSEAQLSISPYVNVTSTAPSANSVGQIMSSSITKGTPFVYPTSSISMKSIPVARCRRAFTGKETVAQHKGLEFLIKKCARAAHPIISPNVKDPSEVQLTSLADVKGRLMAQSASFTEVKSPSVAQATSFTEVKSPSVVQTTSFTEVKGPSVAQATSFTEGKSPSVAQATSFTEGKSPSVVQTTSFTEVKSPSVVQTTSFNEVKSPSVVQTTSFTEVKGPSVVQTTSFTEVKSPSVVQTTSFNEVKRPSVAQPTSFTEVKGSLVAQPTRYTEVSQTNSFNEVKGPSVAQSTSVIEVKTPPVSMNTSFNGIKELSEAQSISFIEVKCPLVVQPTSFSEVKGPSVAQSTIFTEIKDLSVAQSTLFTEEKGQSLAPSASIPELKVAQPASSTIVKKTSEPKPTNFLYVKDKPVAQPANFLNIENISVVQPASYPKSRVPTVLAKLQLLRDTVQSLLSKKNLAPVPPQELGSGFYSNLFVVPKKDSGCHHILDLKCLNMYAESALFKMESLCSVITAMYPGESLDLQDA
ncbi:uncharacterized protein WCC33_000051 [Rhinophrynus dorsalis]